MIRRNKLIKQIEEHKQAIEDFNKGNEKNIISTGSTLLDLAISGGRIRGGGIPAGIMVEIFGPPSCGKTILLCEIAGNIQQQGGNIMFHDPEGRLNKQFAKLFGLDIARMDYSMPNTVPEVFQSVRNWNVEENKIHGIFTDSLAALSTDLEMKEDSDKYGLRRAKEFSEECRKTCRVLPQKGFLMVCSNQIRQNIDAGPYGQKYITPGGESIGFYSSLRLRCSIPQKIKKTKTVFGKEETRTIGVGIQVEVYKSSVWKPYHIAPITILHDYGIDDINENLKFIKAHSNKSIYTIGNRELSKSIAKATSMVESNNLENEVKEEVITLWEKIEGEFKKGRKEKH